MKPFFACLLLNLMNLAAATSQENPPLDFINKVLLDPTYCPASISKEHPIYFQHSPLKSQTTSSELTILKIENPSQEHQCNFFSNTLDIQADIILATNLSIESVCDLYESLQNICSYFLYVPGKSGHVFVASTYPLINPSIIKTQQNNNIQEILQFNVQEVCQIDVSLNDFSSYIASQNYTESRPVTSETLSDLPIILTVLYPSFSPYESGEFIHDSNYLTTEFEFLYAKNKEKSNDNRGGYSAEIEINRSWGGKERGSWGIAGRAEVRDNQGNYVEAEVKQNDKGEGALSAKAGHEKE